MPKLSIIGSPKSGISYHRLQLPISFLNMGGDWVCEPLLWGEEEHKIDCDVLWYSKYLMMDPKWIAKLKDKGMKIIVDIDDHPQLPVGHPHYKKWTDNNRTQIIIENIKLADVVTCTTMKLQDAMRQYNKNTVVIPNAFPYGHNQFQPGPKEQSDKMRFIYSGGSTHYPDIKLMEGKFKRIGGDKYLRDRTQYILAGYEPQMKRTYLNPQDAKAQNNNWVTLPTRGEWDKMVSVFKATNSHRVLPSLDLENYLNHYDNADVALVPLVQSEWNSYKSTLKVAEASTRKLPVICSKVEPYYPELQSMKGIQWVENNDWITPIKYYANNPQAAVEHGEQLAEQMWEQYDLIKWNETRKQLLNSLV